MVKLISYSKDYLELILGASAKCYGRQPKSIEPLVKSQHLSVLEHAYATFDIKCSLGVLGQITRHRHFSFTVKSTRGADFEDYCIPDEIDYGIRVMYLSAIEDAFDVYQELIANGVAKQDAAYVLPKATMTELRITGNLRSWFEYLPKRVCKRAMPEHREIAIGIQHELALVMPEIFDRNFRNCDNCKEEKKCAF